MCVQTRPHSWHSTLQRGLARARSRSLGRDREKDKAKRASSALNHGKQTQRRIDIGCHYLLFVECFQYVQIDCGILLLQVESSLAFTCAF